MKVISVPCGGNNNAGDDVALPQDFRSAVTHFVQRLGGGGGGGDDGAKIRK